MGRLTSRIVPGDWSSVAHAIATLDAKLNTDSSPIFLSLGLTGLTENALMYADGDGVLTSLAAATNGQLIIGSTNAAPSVAALTGTGNQIIVTPGAGSITLSTPQDIDATATPTFARLTLTDTCLIAGGANFLRVTGLQTDGVAMTGTLRGAYIDVSNGSTAATGTIRGMELKARTEAPGDTGNNVTVLEGLSISADSKDHSVTTMRAAEFILDGSTGGTITEAVGLRIANNLQANKATASYGLQIYRDSFDYTYDIVLSLGGHITGDSYVNQDLRTTASPTFAGGTFTEVVTGVTPTAGTHLATKEYVDLALGAFKTFFFSDTGSGVGALNYAYPHETEGPQSTIVTDPALGADDPDPQLIKGFITEAGEPATTTIHSGVIVFHLHAKKGASNQRTTVLNAILSKVAADGTSSKVTIATTEDSAELTETETTYTLHATLSTDVEVLSTDRLILDVYASVGSGAQDSVITFYMEGTEDSYFTAEVDSGIWQNHDDGLDSLASLTYAAASFVKMTGANTFALRTIGETADDLEGTIVHDNLAGLTIAAHDTTATGANLTSLTDNSIVNTLHRHSELVASDGTPDPALIVNAAGQVGIGIAAPLVPLHVYDATSTTPLRLESLSEVFTSFDLQNSHANAAGTTVRWRPMMVTRKTGGYGGLSAGSFAIRESKDATDHYRFVIDGTGKVGIGIVAPLTLFNIGSDHTITTPIIRITDTNDGASVALDDVFGSLEFYTSDTTGNAPLVNASIKCVSGFDGSSGARRSDLVFSTYDYDDAAVTEYLRIKYDGKIGIGTPTPVTLLTVEGTITLKEQANADGDTAGYGQLWCTDNAGTTELWFTNDAGLDTQIV